MFTQDQVEAVLHYYRLNNLMETEGLSGPEAAIRYEYAEQDLTLSEKELEPLLAHYHEGEELIRTAKLVFSNPYLPGPATIAYFVAGNERLNPDQVTAQSALVERDEGYVAADKRFRSYALLEKKHD
jgi:hypothetical protein